MQFYSSLAFAALAFSAMLSNDVVHGLPIQSLETSGSFDMASTSLPQLGAESQMDLSSLAQTSASKPEMPKDVFGNVDNLALYNLYRAFYAVLNSDEMTQLLASKDDGRENYRAKAVALTRTEKFTLVARALSLSKA